VTREDFRSLQGDGTASEKREEQSFSVLRSPVAANQNDIGNEIFLSVLGFVLSIFGVNSFSVSPLGSTARHRAVGIDRIAFHTGKPERTGAALTARR
jgi:hypothetical protein